MNNTIQKFPQRTQTRRVNEREMFGGEEALLVKTGQPTNI